MLDLNFFDRPWWSVPSWTLVDPRMLALLANRAARWFWSSWKGNSRIAPPPVSSQVPEEVGVPDHPQVPLIPTCTSCTSYYRASDPTGKGIWHPEDPTIITNPFINKLTIASLFTTTYTFALYIDICKRDSNVILIDAKPQRKIVK